MHEPILAQIDDPASKVEGFYCNEPNLMQTHWNGKTKAPYACAPWSPELPARFKTMHGYDLFSVLPAIFEGEDGGAGDRAGDFDVTLIRVIAITLSSTLIPLLRGPKDKQSTMILAVLYTALFAYALLTSCFRRQVTFILGSSVIVVCLIGLGYAADGFRSDNPASATATFLPETTGTDEELGDVNKKDSSESLNDDSLTSISHQFF